MAGDDAGSRVHGVVVGRMDTVFVSVLDHHVVRQPTSPAGMPFWKMVFEICTLHVLKLWCSLG